MEATYLDHNASTSLPETLASEWEALVRKSLASPSSLHGSGRAARRLVNEATESVSRFLQFDAEFAYWTSGATEANTWVLHSVFERALFEGRPHPRFIVSPLEHDSILMAARWFEKKGAVLRWLQVDSHGVVDLQDLQVALGEGPADLVSVMLANNETGVIQPIEAISRLCQVAKVPFHADCAQALGKLPVNLKVLGPTYATFSGHKIGAPKGVGLLAVQGEGRLLTPLLHGKQQHGLRGGTENPFSIAMMGRVLEAFSKGLKPLPEGLSTWKADFESELIRRIPGTRVHGEGVARLPNTTYVGFEGSVGDGILLNLDLEGIHVSSGSACSSGSVDPSHVLLAMGCDRHLARSSIRFSAGRTTVWADYERVLNVLPEIVQRVRRANQ